MWCRPCLWRTSECPVKGRRHSGRLACAPVLRIYDGFMEPRSMCSSVAGTWGRGIPVFLLPWAIFSEGAGAGVCSVSGWENSHSGLLPGHLSPEICEGPFLGRAWDPFATHLLRLLLSQNNSIRCHSLTNDDIGKNLFFLASWVFVFSCL